MDLIVRGRTFQFLNDKNGKRYVGQFTQHVSGYAIQQLSGEWTPALAVRNPFRNQTLLQPIDRNADTPSAALELAFDAAEEIEARFARVQAERKHGTASQYDGLTAHEARVEAEYNALMRAERSGWTTRTFLGIAAFLIWFFLF